MGYARLMGMRGSATDDVALEWHMKSNLYPAPPRSMIAVAKEAIEACRNEDYDKVVALPDGVSHRVYGTEVPAFIVVEQFRLEGFIDEEVQ